MILQDELFRPRLPRIGSFKKDVVAGLNDTDAKLNLMLKVDCQAQGWFPLD